MQLHKRDVVDAATALLDNYGIADLTMRRLARELNVSPGALYWHFANKQQLLGAVADRILEPRRRRARRLARPRRGDLPAAARRTAVAHRRRRAGVGELRGRPVGGDGADSRAADRRRGRAGVDPAHAELAARTVVYYVLGFTADEQSRLQWDAAGADLPDEQSVLSDDPSARFAFGLRLLVDGIAAHSRPTDVSAKSRVSRTSTSVDSST